MKNIDYLITGTHKDGYLEVTGAGKVDNTAGQYEMTLNVKEYPTGWDPHIIPLMCCDNLSYYAAQFSTTRTDDIDAQRVTLSEISNSGGATGGPCGQRIAAVVDEKGKMVVLVRARGYLYIGNDTITSRTVVLEGFYDRLSEYGGIKRVHSCRESITKTIPHLALGMSIFKVECHDGTILFGHRSFPYYFDKEQRFDDPLNLSLDVDSSGLQGFKSGSKQVSFSVNIQETTAALRPIYP